VGGHGARRPRPARGGRVPNRRAGQAEHRCRAIESVARQLGNTPTICRKCYVHPAVIDAYLDGVTVFALQHRTERRIGEAVDALAPQEALVLACCSSGWRARRSRRGKPPPDCPAV